MNIRERVMAVCRREDPDRIPFLIFENLLPRGHAERRFRDLGLGLWAVEPVYRMENPKVKIREARYFDTWYSRESFIFGRSVSGGIVSRTYHTPAGEVSSRSRVGLGYEGSEWCMEYMIKDLADYDAVKYLVEETVYIPSHETFLKRDRIIGDDGIVLAYVPKSPLQLMLHVFMGHKRFALDYYRHRREFEDLMRVIWRKETEIYRIVADSPAEVVWCGDNVDGIILGPKTFERYHVPFYNEVARILHKKGKTFAVHLDGRLRCLSNAIQKTNIDIVEAFTPPPMGDLSIEEAKAAWKGKFIIYVNFPTTVFLSERRSVKKYALDVLRSIAPGEGFIIGVTENIPTHVFESSLGTAVETIAHYGNCPISRESLPFTA